MNLAVTLSRKLYLLIPVLTLAFASTEGSAQTVKQYFVKNNKTPTGKMAATPMVGNYSDHRGSGVEIGGKFSFEPFPNGFIQPINDSVSFEGGLFQGFGKNHSRFLTVASMRWDFNLIPMWSVFGAPGIAHRSDEYKRSSGGTETSTEAGVAFSVGGLFHIQPKQSLRFEYDALESTMRAGYMFHF